MKAFYCPSHYKEKNKQKKKPVLITDAKGGYAFTCFICRGLVGLMAALKKQKQQKKNTTPDGSQQNVLGRCGMGQGITH